MNTEWSHTDKDARDGSKLVSTSILLSLSSRKTGRGKESKVYWEFTWGHRACEMLSSHILIQQEGTEIDKLGNKLKATLTWALGRWIPKCCSFHLGHSNSNRKVRINVMGIQVQTNQVSWWNWVNPVGPQSCRSPTWIRQFCYGMQHSRDQN